MTKTTYQQELERLRELSTRKGFPAKYDLYHSTPNLIALINLQAEMIEEARKALEFYCHEAMVTIEDGKRVTRFVEKEEGTYMARKALTLLSPDREVS